MDLQILQKSHLSDLWENPALVKPALLKHARSCPVLLWFSCLLVSLGKSPPKDCLFSQKAVQGGGRGREASPPPPTENIL